MSYVIQNFTSTYYLPPFNYRSKMLFLIRTLRVAVVLLKHNLLMWGNSWTSSYNISLIATWKSQFFNKSIEKNFKTLIKAPKVFHANNLLKSLQHWILVEATQLLENAFNFNSRRPRITHYHFNIYNRPLPISNIALHNKNYSKTLMYFLSLLLTNWTLFNRDYSNALQYTIIQPHHTLVRYYNLYYFKIFNF